MTGYPVEMTTYPHLLDIYASVGYTEPYLIKRGTGIMKLSSFYHLAYIDKMWGIMRREAFPERIEL